MRKSAVNCSASKSVSAPLLHNCRECIQRKMRQDWPVNHDELSFRRPFRFGSLQFSNPCRAADRDPRPSSPTRGFPKERAASLAPSPHRPTVVGSVVAILVGLAPQPTDRPARHGHPLAQESFRLVLDKEIAAAPGKTRGGSRNS